MALDGASFAVAAGEILGVLGPNGAGKTTAIECMAGLAAPDEGIILFQGKPINRYSRRRIGVALQAMALQDAITPRETLMLFAKLYGARPEIDDLLSSVGLADRADARFSTLSGGQKQRLNLALALINDPTLLLLDEPTTGLDQAGESMLLGTVRRLAADGRAVVLTTHNLEQAERICDRLVIIDRGRVIASGAPAELVGGGSSSTVIEGEATTAFEPPSFGPLRGLRWDGHRFRLRTADPTSAVASLVEHIQRQNGAIVTLKAGPTGLEDVLLDLLQQWPPSP